MSNDPDVIKINGLKLNGTSPMGTINEVKTPFLIGVAGGTASGKVKKKNVQNMQTFAIVYATSPYAAQLLFPRLLLFNANLSINHNKLNLFLIEKLVNRLPTNYGAIGSGRCGSSSKTGKSIYERNVVLKVGLCLY